MHREKPELAENRRQEATKRDSGLREAVWRLET